MPPGPGDDSRAAQCFTIGRRWLGPARSLRSVAPSHVCALGARRLDPSRRRSHPAILSAFPCPTSEQPCSGGRRVFVWRKPREPLRISGGILRTPSLSGRRVSGRHMSVMCRVWRQGRGTDERIDSDRRAGGSGRNAGAAAFTVPSKKTTATR